MKNELEFTFSSFFILVSFAGLFFSKKSPLLVEPTGIEPVSQT